MDIRGLAALEQIGDLLDDLLLFFFLDPTLDLNELGLELFDGEMVKRFAHPFSPFEGPFGLQQVYGVR